MGEVHSLTEARERRERVRDEPWIGKAEVAAHLGCSVRTVNRRMALPPGKRIPFVKRFANSHAKFQRSAVDAWMEGR